MRRPSLTRFRHFLKASRRDPPIHSLDQQKSTMLAVSKLDSAQHGQFLNVDNVLAPIRSNLQLLSAARVASRGCSDLLANRLPRGIRTLRRVQRQMFWLQLPRYSDIRREPGTSRNSSKASWVRFPGTRCSALVWAANVSLLNNARIRAGNTGVLGCLNSPLDTNERGYRERVNAILRCQHSWNAIWCRVGLASGNEVWHREFQRMRKSVLSL